MNRDYNMRLICIHAVFNHTEDRWLKKEFGYDQTKIKAHTKNWGKKLFQFFEKLKKKKGAKYSTQLQKENFITMKILKGKTIQLQAN